MREIINIINDEFKDYKINIDVEEKAISYLNSNNDWLGDFYLETNEFIYNYYLMIHFNNEMIEFLKPIIGKIINKKLNEI